MDTTTSWSPEKAIGALRQGAELTQKTGALAFEDVREIIKTTPKLQAYNNHEEFRDALALFHSVILKGQQSGAFTLAVANVMLEALEHLQSITKSS